MDQNEKPPIPDLDEEDIETTRDKLHISHIHEDAQKLIVTDDEGNYQGLPDEEYYKIMHTEDTRNSELSSNARLRINN